jgi:hypothetical protein
MALGSPSVSSNPACRLADNILWRDVVCRDLGADVSREDVTAQAAIVMSGGHYADWYGTATECLCAGRTGMTRRSMRTSKYPSRMHFSQSPLFRSPLFVTLIRLQQPVRGVHQTQSAVDLMALRVHDIPRECMCLTLAWAWHPISRHLFACFRPLDLLPAVHRRKSTDRHRAFPCTAPSKRKTPWQPCTCCVRLAYV